MSRVKKTAQVCAIGVVCVVGGVLAGWLVVKLFAGMLLTLGAFVGNGVASALGLFGLHATPSAALWLLFCAFVAASLARSVVRK